MEPLHILAVLCMLVFMALGVRAWFAERAVIRRELDELHRWRSGWSEAERWLAEFPDSAAALEHLKARAIGAGGTDIVATRDAMRERRDRG